MSRVANIGGCCGCGVDDPPEGCAFTLEAQDCFTNQCPFFAATYDEIPVSYEIYYPADDATPLCSGAMTLDFQGGPPTSGGLPIYRSDPCLLPAGTGLKTARYRILATGTGRAAVTEGTTSFFCYFPSGQHTARRGIALAPGYECTCGERPTPIFPGTGTRSLILTTGRGAVTLTNNTPGPFPFPFAAPNRFRGSLTTAVPQMADCSPGPAPGQPCPVGPGSVKVYFEAEYYPCGFQLRAVWGLGAVTEGLFGFPCYGAAKAIAVGICEQVKALGCLTPYIDCADYLINYHLPTPDVDMWSVCTPSMTVSWPTAYFSPSEGADVVASCNCLSWEPILYECVFEPFTGPCPPQKYLRHHLFPDGDTWTLTEA